MTGWNFLEWPEKAAAITAAVFGLSLSFGKVRAWFLGLWGKLSNVFLVPNAMVLEFGANPEKRIREAFIGLTKHADIAALQHQVMSQHLGFGLYICDAKGKCIQVNGYLCDLFGLPHEEMLGFGWLRCVAAEDRQRVHSAWMWAVENDIPYRDTYRIEDEKTGESKWVRTEAFLAKKDGAVLAIAGVLHETEPPDEKPKPPPTATGRIREKIKRSGNGPIMGGPITLMTS